MIRLKCAKYAKIPTQCRAFAQGIAFNYNPETGIYKSKYEINVPQTNVHDFVWQNLSKYENRTAFVSVNLSNYEFSPYLILF
jgi:hypothetical protein